MQVIVDEDLCTGCGLCCRVCPQMILVLRNKKLAIEELSRCCGCFGCEDECEAGAVRLLRAPPSVQTVRVEKGPTLRKTCDVAVVGAGPAGLGAAIACARAGLDTVVLERLPNRSLSHHPDGGVMFTLPFITTMDPSETGIVFPELGIELRGKMLRPCRRLGLIGPDGLATESAVPDEIEAWAGSKDRFVEALVGAAEKEGAVVHFGCKVNSILKEKGRIRGLGLADGEIIRARTVVCADGVLAGVSKMAGFAVDESDLWHCSILAYEYENVKGLESGIFYINGDMDLEEGMPPAFGAVSIADGIHVLMAFFSRDRFHAAPKPMEYYLELLLAKDKRVKSLVGTALDGCSPSLISGCRSVFRGRCNTDVVLPGAITVGDAWVSGGEIGNIPALANGVWAGAAIADAAGRGTLDEGALRPLEPFVTPKLVSIIEKNKDMRLLTTRLDAEEMRRMFLFMQHLSYPILLMGSPLQQIWAFARFFCLNAGNLIRYPDTLRHFR